MLKKKLKKMGIEGYKHITSTNNSTYANFRLEQTNDIYPAKD
jgi:hypothetical protein